MIGAWCFGCCQAQRGLPVWFLLLRYSVLFTVESLSLLYLPFISWLICSRRWCIDKLGVFYANQHIYLLIHIWTKGEAGAPLNRFKPSSKIFLLTVPRWCFFCGSFVISVLFCYAFIHVCSLMPCGLLLGKGWPLGSRLRCLFVTLSLSHLYPGSGVVLYYIDSWSLPSFLLLLINFFQNQKIGICIIHSCFYVKMTKTQRHQRWTTAILDTEHLFLSLGSHWYVSLVICYFQWGLS